MSSNNSDHGLWLFILGFALFIQCNNVQNNSKNVEDLEERIEKHELKIDDLEKKVKSLR